MSLFRTLSVVSMVGTLLALYTGTTRGEELLHYWDMDSLVGGVPTDVVGGLATSENGTVTLNTGYGAPYAGAGNALVSASASPNYLVAEVFDGTATAMDFGTDDFSFSYWSYDDFTDGDGRGPRVFDCLSLDNTVGFHMAATGDGVFNLRMEDDGDGSVISKKIFTASQPRNTWTHVAVNVGRTSDAVEVFFNGTSRGAFDISDLTGALFPTQDLQIGVINSGVDVPSAQPAGLDDLAFYSGLLSLENISGLADGSITPLAIIVIDHEPFAWDTLGDGNWNDARWIGDAPGSVPDATTSVFVDSNTVTVAADAFVHSLTVDNAGAIVVNTDSVLAITDSLLVDNGTINVAPKGEIPVGGAVTFTDGSVYVSELGEAGNGLISSTGNVSLLTGSTLVMQATSNLPAIGEAVETIISVDDGVIDGTFTNAPVLDEHLGRGVFFKSVEYTATTADAHVFQAVHGDLNGNGEVNILDIFAIKGSDKGFGTGATDATWIDGDMVGATLNSPADGIVNIMDIFAIKTAGYFGAGSYAAGDETTYNAVPEPGTLVMMAMGLLALAFYSQRGPGVTTGSRNK